MSENEKTDWFGPIMWFVISALAILFYGVVMTLYIKPRLEGPIDPAVQVAQQQERYRWFVMFESCERLYEVSLSRNRINIVREKWNGDMSELNTYFDEVDALHQKWCKKK